MLDELERLDQAATPGPWAANRGSHGVMVLSPLNIIVATCSWGTDEANTANSALICAARNALPALLRVARAAQTLLDQVPSAIDDPELDEAREALETALAALEGAEGRE